MGYGTGCGEGIGTTRCTRCAFIAYCKVGFNRLWYRGELQWLMCVNDTTFICYSSDYDGNEGNGSARHMTKKVVGMTP